MMPYVPKFRHLFKILFRVQDERAAEGLYLEGTWLSDNGDDEGARLAFAHARLLDRKFGGAFYNYAALTEKKFGAVPDTLKAWEEYARAAENDPRQRRETIEKVKEHIRKMKDDARRSP